MRKVLLVDDDNVTNFLNEWILKKLKIGQIITTENGAEALQYLVENCKDKKDCPPDVIILDINMPIINGIEFLNVLQKVDLRKSPKIVVLTGMNIEEYLQKSKVQGLTILEKPLTEEAIKQVLSSAA